MSKIDLDALRKLAAETIPGPWKHTNDVSEERCADIESLNDNLYIRASWGSMGRLAKGEKKKLQLALEANAHLIAAAPDLLTALIDMLEAQAVPVAQQEPVAYMVRSPNTGKARFMSKSKKHLIDHWECEGYEVTALCAAPQPVAQPLPDDPRVSAIYLLRDIAERDDDTESLHIISAAISELCARTATHSASVQPVAEPVEALTDLPAPLLYYRANSDESIEWAEDCVCCDPVYDREDDHHSGKAYSETQVLAILAASRQAEPAQATGLSTAPMCERKTNEIMQRDGFIKVGYVLQNPGGDYCLSAHGAVCWLSAAEYNWIMHNRDHVEFQWPKPVGALNTASQHTAQAQDKIDAERYRWLLTRPGQIGAVLWPHAPWAHEGFKANQDRFELCIDEERLEIIDAARAASKGASS